MKEYLPTQMIFGNKIIRYYHRTPVVLLRNVALVLTMKHTEKSRPLKKEELQKIKRWAMLAKVETTSRQPFSWLFPSVTHNQFDYS